MRHFIVRHTSWLHKIPNDLKKRKRQFRDLLNQCQACLPLFEYIFHGEFKYSIIKFIKLEMFELCEMLDLSSAHTCRVLSSKAHTYSETLDASVQRWPISERVAPRTSC